MDSTHVHTPITDYTEGEVVCSTCGVVICRYEDTGIGFEWRLNYKTKPGSIMGSMKKVVS